MRKIFFLFLIIIFSESNSEENISPNTLHKDLDDDFLIDLDNYDDQVDVLNKKFDLLEEIENLRKELKEKDLDKEQLVKFYDNQIENLNLRIQFLQITINNLEKQISNQSSLNDTDSSYSSNENLKYFDTGFVIVNGKKWSIPDFSLEFPEDHQRKRLQVYGYIRYFYERNYGSPEYQFHLQVNEGKLCFEGKTSVCTSNDDWVIVIATTDNKITPNKAKQESKQWKKKLREVEDEQYLVKMSGTVSFWSDSRKITMIVDRIDKIDKKPD